jgi:hypothetical protein
MKNKTTTFPSCRAFDLNLFKAVNKKRIEDGWTWNFLLTKLFYKYLETK